MNKCYICLSFAAGAAIGAVGASIYWRRQMTDLEWRYEDLKAKMRMHTPDQFATVAAESHEDDETNDVEEEEAEDTDPAPPTKEQINTYRQSRGRDRPNYHSINQEKHGSLPPKPELEALACDLAQLELEPEEESYISPNGDETHVLHPDDLTEVTIIHEANKGPHLVEPIYEDPDYPIPGPGPDGWRPPYSISPFEFTAGGEEQTKETITYYEEDGVLVDEQNQRLDGVTQIGDCLGMLKGMETLYVRNERMGVDFEVVVDEGSFHESVLGYSEYEDLSAYERIIRRRKNRGEFDD